MRTARQLKDTASDEERRAEGAESEAQLLERKAHDRYEEGTPEFEREMSAALSFRNKAQQHKELRLQYEQEAAQVEAQAQELEAEKERIKAEMNQRLADIEKQQQALKGE